MSTKTMDLKEHPLFDPIHEWVASKFGLPATDVAAEVTEHIVTQIINHNGMIGCGLKRMEMRADLEEIAYEFEEGDTKYQIRRDDLLRLAEPVEE